MTSSKRPKLAALVPRALELEGGVVPSSNPVRGNRGSLHAEVFSTHRISSSKRVLAQKLNP